MPANDLFGIHGTALALRGQRMAMLASNIANAATPNYKARDIDFFDALRRAQAGEDLEGAVQYRVPLQSSLDGNTVELATEQTAFTENALAYRTTLSFLNGRISTLSRAEGRMTMASPLSIFDISGRAMAAQLLRLNTTASNLANAGTVAGSEAQAFRALKPVFRAVGGSEGQATVAVDRVTTTTAAPTKRHEPNHPLADKNGDVWEAAVDGAAELVEMLETSRQYQNNVQVLQTAKSLTLDTLRLGQ